MLRAMIPPALALLAAAPVYARGVTFFEHFLKKQQCIRR